MTHFFPSLLPWFLSSFLFFFPFGETVWLICVLGLSKNPPDNSNGPIYVDGDFLRLITPFDLKPWHSTTSTAWTTSQCMQGATPQTPWCGIVLTTCNRFVGCLTKPTSTMEPVFISFATRWNENAVSRLEVQMKNWISNETSLDRNTTTPITNGLHNKI